MTKIKINMEDFCGGTLWNNSFTWNTEKPDFTPCFESTLFAWVPAAFLLIGIPFEIAAYKSSVDRHLPFGVFSVTKILMSLGMAACTVVEMLMLEKDVAISHYVGPAVKMIAYLATAIMTVTSVRNGVITSGPQFVFWLVGSICGALTFRTAAIIYIEANFPDEGKLRDNFILTLAHLAGSVILLLLNCFADKTTNMEYLRSKNPCPEYSASFLNCLVFEWITQLMWTGWRKPLTPNLLWDISPKLASKTLLPNFEKLLHVQKSANQDSTKQGGRAGEGDKKLQVSILPLLWRSFGSSFALGSVLKLCCDLLQIASPMVMKLMMNFVESWNAAEDSGVVKQEQWKGIFYTGLFFCLLTLQSILLSQYSKHMSVIGVKVRTTLISALYKKSLRISAASKKESSMGEVVNLMSVDVQRFMDLLPYVNILWSAILQIGLGTFFIYQELGWPAFVGVAILFLSILLNGVLATLFRKLALKQMKFKDARIKLMNEILGGMKVLKLYAWEPSFIDQVLGIRNNEVKVMKTTAYYKAIIFFFFTIAPFMVGLGAFTSYIFKDGGQILTAQKAFVTISYLSIIGLALAQLPFMLSLMASLMVSLERINKFMNNEELSEDAVEDKTNDGDAITITGGHFKWGPEDPTVLKDINLSVKEGSLTAIVGSVGSGKSSLVSAMLGELHKEAGRVAVTGRIAYVPQQAWIQNLTLKDNIIFNLANNEEKYQEVVETCALTTDLAILPDGDQTEIGEKGINLSGGQKQRVSMARAVYSDANLFFLDDPLSAVDSHVGKHIFDKVIGPTGILGNKTRILVTHGVTFLPQTDHIIVLKDGRVSEQGSYQDLVEQKGAFAAFLEEYMAGHGEEENKEEGPSDRKEKESADKELDKEETKNENKCPAKGTKTPNTLIEKENAETGSVSLNVYLYYLKAIRLAGCIAAIVGQSMSSATQLMITFWVSLWTSNAFGDASETENRNMYLGVYGAIGLLQSLIVMFSVAIIAFSTLNASKRLHKKMLTRVMMSPMSFFDTTPLGRIINRFAKDVDVCDNTLPQSFQGCLSNFFQFIATILFIMWVIPIFIIVVLPVGVLFFIVQRLYVSTSRQLKRLESISRSPIYSHFGESLQGSSTIRAFRMEKEFINQSQALVDKNQVATN